MSDLVNSLGERWLWLGGSLLVAVVWANVAWFFRRPRTGPVGQFVGRLVAWPFSGRLVQAARLLYYVGIPFAALVVGHDVVLSRFLGLQPLALPTGDDGGSAVAANWRDWTRDIGWSAALGIGLWLVLAFASWYHRRALREIGEPPSGVVGATSGWTAFREAAYHEVHWAFYRNAPIMALGTYWGIWIGLAFTGLEAIVNPGWRRTLSDRRYSQSALTRVSLAFVSGALFLQTQNLWTAMIVHFSVSLGLDALTRMSAAQNSEHSQAGS
jgi:hypothetical protein